MLTTFVSKIILIIVRNSEITTLYCRRKVTKDDLRCEACGTVDEVCSFIGLAKSLIKERRLKRILEGIQRDLFKIGSELATNKGYIKKLKERINKSSLDYLHNNIEELKEKIDLTKRGFIIPGEDFVSSIVDVTRAITRRLERRVVTVKRKKLLGNRYILPYLNKLSNLLYFIARYVEKKPRFK
ncbi:MAG: cob(I)yrinic acid a,c-diamide adenosyltransferase [Candidatus Omnitrophota bacterium]|nr:MAG: cob(I)yrinic acid a,c-diamide adenosyltransferase [Candidatus Omnitrophota bacterium]RKY36554.1 MAG: cob(I)yrinic acid a,c-diamide adenosyltransferase [Candidatus Omnitrophota bacterium]HDN85728.1 cob(I)yrinic acid a,c-diamide adenosyltransferase [Candidatus Omnitrophota bacterium]